MHDEERFGESKAQHLGEDAAIEDRERHLQRAHQLEHAHEVTKRDRADSHKCQADFVNEEIQKQIDLRDFEKQKEIYRNKHGFSPSKYVHVKRKRFKRQRKEHHKERRRSLGLDKKKPHARFDANGNLIHANGEVENGDDDSSSTGNGHHHHRHHHHKHHHHHKKKS